MIHVRGKVASTIDGGRAACSNESQQQIDDNALEPRRSVRAFYWIALIAALSTWLVAIRAPLRVDETGSYWQIAGGFSQIWPRQFLALSSPAYFYILWCATKLIGASELALRIPSILAMLGAAYLLYRSASELIDSTFAIIATIIFSLNYSVVFAAIDVRQYAFAVLFTNAAILVLIRLLRSDSNWLAALFGLLAAGMFYFHYLFAAILPAFVLFFFVFKHRSARTALRQSGVALAVFAAACIPLIPNLRYLFKTAGNHVVVPSPGFLLLWYSFMPGWLVPSAVLTGLFGLVFAAKNGPIAKVHPERWTVLFCLCLAVVPLLILYAISVAGSLNMFTASYHRLSAVPGISLCWAMALYRFRSNAVRVVFCVLLVGLTVSSYLLSPKAREHDYSWKYALQVVQQMTVKDHAPVVICSNFIEADHEKMPTHSPKSNRLFAPLLYYKIASPIVALPEHLNDQTKQIFLPFLAKEQQKHQRFLAVGEQFSFQALDWLAQAAAKDFSVRTVGTYDRVRILEFLPRKN